MIDFTSDIEMQGFVAKNFSGSDSSIPGFAKVLLQFIYFKYNVTVRTLLRSFYM